MLLASCSLDDIVKIIEVSGVSGRVKENYDLDEYDEDIKTNPRFVRKQRKQKKNKGGD